MVAKAAKQASVKTTRTGASVAAFIDAVEGESQRADAKAIDRMLREITGETPAMWGPSLVGYGSWTQTNSMGQAEWPKIAFSPRKSATVLYIEPKLLASDPLMERLGTHSCGKSCLYINRLADVDQGVLRELATKSWKQASETYG
jgi:hypothetical protein